MEHLFWTIFCFLTIAWYIIVTMIVAFKGGFDIKRMLEKLDKEAKGINSKSGQVSEFGTD